MNRIVPKPDRKPFTYSFLPPCITIALLPVISSEALRSPEISGRFVSCRDNSQCATPDRKPSHNKKYPPVTMMTDGDFLFLSTFSEL